MNAFVLIIPRLLQRSLLSAPFWSQQEELLAALSRHTEMRCKGSSTSAKQKTPEAQSMYCSQQT